MSNVKFNLGDEVYCYSNRRKGTIVGFNYKDHRKWYVDFTDSVKPIPGTDLILFDTYVQQIAAANLESTGCDNNSQVSCNCAYAIAAIKFLSDFVDADFKYSAKEYYYKLFNADKYSIGDFVLCRSSLGLRLAKIVGIMTVGEAKAKFNRDIDMSIICSVDLCDYIERLHTANEYNECKKELNNLIDSKNVDVDKIIETTYRLNALKDKF